MFKFFGELKIVLKRVIYFAAKLLKKCEKKIFFILFYRLNAKMCVITHIL